MNERRTDLVRRDAQVPAAYDQPPVRHLIEEVTRYDPQPTAPPVADPELPRLPPAQRLAAVSVYTYRRWAHTLSPGGGIQAWWRIFIRIALVLLAPALLLLPLLVWIAAKLVALVGQLVLLLVAVLKAVAVACGIVLALMVLRELFRHAGRTRR